MSHVLYQVVVNGRGQYSIWRAERARPAGWEATAWSGTKEECLARIASVWTDIRPKRR
jgi:MbtH protein